MASEEGNLDKDFGKLNLSSSSSHNDVTTEAVGDSFGELSQTQTQTQSFAINQNTYALGLEELDCEQEILSSVSDEVRLEYDIIKQKTLSKNGLPSSSKIEQKIDNTNTLAPLADHFNMKQSDKNALFLARSGGGSPALTFLKILQIRKYQSTVQTLIDKLRECGEIMSRAVDILKGYPENKKIGEIKQVDIVELSNLLIDDLPGFPSWKNLADEFGMEDVKNTCENSVKSENTYSPCTRMFQIIRIKHIRFTVEDLIEVYKKEKHEAIVEFIVKEVLKKAKKIVGEQNDDNELC